MASGTSADEELRAAHSEVPAHPAREVYWPGLGRGEWIAWEHGPANAVAWVLALGFAGLLGFVTLRSAAGRPDWVLGWRISSAFVVFTGVVLVGRYLALGRDGEPRWLFPVQVGLLAVIGGAVYSTQTPGIGVGIDRTLEAGVVAAALVGFCVCSRDPREYSLLQWVVLASFGVFTAVFFYHSLAMAPSTAQARHPAWGAVLLGLWLVVLPRYVPAELFLWALARVAAVVTLLGLAVYVVGPYTLWGLDIGFYGDYTLPIPWYEIRAMRSYFYARNTFALLALAGFISAIAEYHRNARDEQGFWSLLGPSMLILITGAGYFLAYGRALWVLGLIPLVVYFAYVDFGRGSIPVTTVASMLYLFGGILAVFFAWRLGYIDTPPGNRFTNWGASITAILANPSLLGEGLIASREFINAYTGNFINPYAENVSSPHNSYLGTWIRMGAVGGLAYLGLVVGALAAGLRRYRTVDVAVFALALAFAAHQVFESYTMFRWVIGSAIAAMSIGYAGFGEWN